MKSPPHTRGVTRLDSYRRRIPSELTSSEQRETSIAASWEERTKPGRAEYFHRTVERRHDETMALLAAEEAAFTRTAEAATRAILLITEYKKMSEDMTPLNPVPPSDFMLMVANATREPGIEPAKLQQLLEMAERMMKFEAERAFNNAMRACQEEIRPIAKDAENKHTGTTYAKLESIDMSIRPVYLAHGFVMSFGSGPARKEGAVRVTCDVRHESGHTVQYELEGDLDVAGAKGTANKTGIQGLGSTVTNLRRYLTMMIWNITLADRNQLYISKYQAAQVWDALDTAGIAGPRRREFLKFAQAETVETIGSLRYNDVMMMLKRAVANKDKPQSA